MVAICILFANGFLGRVYKELAVEDRLMVSVSGVRGTVGGTLTPKIAMDMGLRVRPDVGRRGRRNVKRSSSAATRGPPARCSQRGRDGLARLRGRRGGPGRGDHAGHGLHGRAVKADGGVIITASHNPPQYNGMKFLQPNGCWPPAAAGQRAQGIWKARQFAARRHRRSVGQETRNVHTHGLPRDAVCGVRLTRHRLQALQGRAGQHQRRRLRRDADAAGQARLRVVHLNAEPNGRFAHSPSRSRRTSPAWARRSPKHKAAVGFAQDPDADRLAIVDENGRYIGEEYTLALATAFVLRHRRARSRPTCHLAHDRRHRRQRGVDVLRTAVGEANVVEAMLPNGAIFGGEGNGGVIDPRVGARPRTAWSASPTSCSTWPRRARRSANSSRRFAAYDDAQDQVRVPRRRGRRPVAVADRKRPSPPRGRRFNTATDFASTCPKAGSTSASQHRADHAHHRRGPRCGCGGRSCRRRGPTVADKVIG